MPDFAKDIAASLSLKPSQVQAAIELLDGGATVPFIARYRKEPPAPWMKNNCATGSAKKGDALSRSPHRGDRLG